MSKDVALVLSGGGARGIAHIGVIEVLEEHGYNIKSISGTSMGAVVGGIYALNKLNAFKEWLFKLDRTAVFRLVDFTILGGAGFVKGERVLNTIKRFTQDANIEDLSIDYSAVATNIDKQTEVVFTSGSLFEAIRASIAIPTVLTPVKTEEGHLVDGGILNNLPLDHVKRHDNDMLFAVNVNAEIPNLLPAVSEPEKENTKKSAYQKRMAELTEMIGKLMPARKKSDSLGYFDLINDTINVVVNANAIQAIKFHNPDKVFKISNKSANTFDFFKAEELYEIGRYVAKQELAKTKN
ncbi:MAG: patatin-like phospholipase family protein [Bacteroidia bacterium]